MPARDKQNAADLKSRRLFARHVARARRDGTRLEYDLAGLRLWLEERLLAKPNCAYCGCFLGDAQSPWTIDHVIASARGGRAALANLCLCCDAATRPRVSSTASTSASCCGGWRRNPCTPASTS